MNNTVHPWDYFQLKSAQGKAKEQNQRRLRIGFCSVFPPFQNGAAAGSYYIVRELAKHSEIDLFLIPINKKIDKRLFSFMPLRFATTDDPSLDVIIFWCLGQDFQHYTKKASAKKIGWQTMHKEPEEAAGEQETVEHMKTMDLVLAVTKWAYSCYKKQMSQTSYLPFGVDPSLFQPAHETTSQHKHKKEQRMFNCLFISRIHYYKGIMPFLDAIDLVMKKDRNFSFKIIAAVDKYSPHIDEINKKMNDLKQRYPTHVTVDRSWISYAEIPKQYANTDLLIFPSNNEGFGIPIIEAMSTEIPCLVLDKKPMNEIVHHGKTGYCIPSSNQNDVYHGFTFPDPVKIAQKIFFLKNHEYVRRKMGETARKHVMAYYNLPKIIEQLLLHCTSLVSSTYIVKAPKIELCSIHYESQFEVYSNKEKRLHYPAEAI